MTKAELIEAIEACDEDDMEVVLLDPRGRYYTINGVSTDEDAITLHMSLND